MQPQSIKVNMEMNRSSRDVFEDHLQLRRRGDLDTDLEKNYAEGVVLLCETGVLVGRDAIRQSAARLGLQLPEAEFDFVVRQVEGNYAMLVWNARSSRFQVDHGVDSFVIQNGRIIAQTIFYRLARGRFSG